MAKEAFITIFLLLTVSAAFSISKAEEDVSPAHLTVRKKLAFPRGMIAIISAQQPQASIIVCMEEGVPCEENRSCANMEGDCICEPEDWEIDPNNPICTHNVPEIPPQQEPDFDSDSEIYSMFDSDIDIDIDIDDNSGTDSDSDSGSNFFSDIDNDEGLTNNLI